MGAIQKILKYKALKFLLPFEFRKFFHRQHIHTFMQPVNKQHVIPYYLWITCYFMTKGWYKRHSRQKSKA